MSFSLFPSENSCIESKNNPVDVVKISLAEVCALL